MAFDWEKCFSPGKCLEETHLLKGHPAACITHRMFILPIKAHSATDAQDFP
jgi:hypothetical protein